MTANSTFIRALVEQCRHEGRDIHERTLVIVEELSEEQLHWRAGLHAPSIAFHLWHLARYADLDAHALDGTVQIWVRERLAEAWGFPASGLGDEATGMGMGDEASEDLVLPGKAALLDYARAAFSVLDERLDALVQTALQQPDVSPQTGPGGLSTLVVTYLAHDGRHLGMIEALRGVMGISGTATR